MLSKYPNLEQALSKRGMMKKQLAKMLNITPYTLSKKLSGKVPFTLDEARSVAELFETSIESLFFSNENRFAEKSKRENLSGTKIYALTRDLIKTTRDKHEDTRL